MTTSYYPFQAQLPVTERLPKHADVVIVGAGIVGCAAAYYLAKAGLSVFLCDKAGLAGQQSSRAWGFVRQQARDVAEVPLMQESVRIWEGLEKELETPLEWRQRGCLFIGETDKQLETYEAWLSSVSGSGLEARVLSGHEIAEVLPTYAKPAKGGLFTPNDGQAEPRRVAPAFAKRASDLGAQIAQGCGVKAIELQGGSICAVETEWGRLETSRVLIAAGADSWRLLRTLGVDLPQQTVRCTVSRTSPGPQISATCFIANGVGFRQRADGSFNIADDLQADVDMTLSKIRGARWYLPLLPKHHSSFRFKLNGTLVHDVRQRFFSGDDPVIGERNPHVVPEDSRIRASERGLADAFPELRNVRVVESWAGLIDTLPDGIPVIDAPSDIPGLMVATGFCGHGFAMGPIVGFSMMQLATAGQAKLDLSSFRLTRFAEGEVKKPSSLF